jgi:hypothetical protein
VALAAVAVLAFSAWAYPSGDYAAYATLRHAPQGYTTLTWSPQTQSLKVTLWLTGLAPDSGHPAHIHSGTCAHTGGIVYSLPTVYADSAGNASMSTTIRGEWIGIPHDDWSINVHNGPGMGTDAQYEPIVCANVYNPNPYLGDDQYAGSLAGPTPDGSQHAWGSTQLWISGSDMLVRLWMGGLAPYSVHAAHIHSGSCASQGGVVYMLRNVVANASGYSDETTVVHGVTSIPYSGWYVNVHRTTDLSTQTGFDPIACGDVYPS